MDKKVQNKRAGRKVGYHGCHRPFERENELRLRIIGESHTALQVLRERLNGHKDVDYANYFPGHPELDEPEFYIRTTSKAGVEKVLNDIIGGVAAEFDDATL